MLNGLTILLFAILALSWGMAAWLWRYRNHLDELNERLPLIHKFRKNRLHPLFGNRADVLGLAGCFFVIGLLMLAVLLMQIL